LKIFILKPSSLGDVIQALPVLRLIKLHRPESQVYWWLEKSLVPLLDKDPDLAGIIPFDRQRWRNPLHAGELFRSIMDLRAHQFDWVIDLQSLLRSGVFAWLANGALTVGLDDAREGARGFYDIAVRRNSWHTHAADWYQAVLPRLGVPVHDQFTWLPPRPQAEAELRNKWQPAPGRWVILSPGARWNNKRWPVEYFERLVQLLHLKDPNLNFAIVGGNDDAPLGARITRVAPQVCLDLTGQTSLVEMVEWIRLGNLVITNDTGPMHVAAGLRKPVIALFGPTEPCRTGPYGQLHNVLRTSLSCVPCMKGDCYRAEPLECLRRILPETVVEKALAALRG
jgi:lipopolysaccharide heptosyltransferase II